MIVEGHVICIPELTQQTHIDVPDPVLTVMAQVSAVHEGGLWVQVPQANEAGAPKAVFVIILNKLLVQAFHPIMTLSIDVFSPSAGGSAWQGRLPTFIIGPEVFDASLFKKLPTLLLIKRILLVMASLPITIFR